MGNSATCLGPQVDVMTTFPSFSSVTYAQSLESDALAVQTTLTNYVAVPVSFVPGAGPFLAYLLTFLATTDFNDISGGLAKLQINEAILENDIIQYNSEIMTIRNSLARLNRTDLSALQLQPEITYALRRCEYLYNIFKNPNHVLSKYPMVSMPHFIRVMNILWATLQISSKLDPTLKSTNDLLLREMSETIRQFITRFYEKRLAGITWYNCGFTIFSSQCLVYDRPWLKTPGAITNYFLTAYQFDQPLNQEEWRDGIVIRTPNGCRPESRDYPKLSQYKDAAEYKRKLREGHDKYFKNAFPVEF